MTDSNTTATSKTGIITALANAQMHMGKAKKDAKNPHFHSQYATLESVTEAVLPALNEQGIAMMHVVSQGRDAVVTMLMKGDDTLTCTVPLIGEPKNIQQFGSAVTYARRYGLMMICGIAPADDDDGNAAATMKVEDKNKTVVERISKVQTLDDLAKARDYVISNSLGHVTEIMQALEEREQDLSVRAE